MHKVERVAIIVLGRQRAHRVPEPIDHVERQCADEYAQCVVERAFVGLVLAQRAAPQSDGVRRLKLVRHSI